MEKHTPPTFIILDTMAHVCQIFEDHGTALSYLKMDNSERTSFDTLIDSMQLEQDALVNIGLLSHELAEELSVINPHIVNLDDLRQQFYELCQYVYRELQMHKLYKRGFLQFKYHGWLLGQLVIRYQPTIERRTKASYEDIINQEIKRALP